MVDVANTGSGYLSACMGLMVGDTGHVLGIERHPSLAKRSEINLRRALPELAEKGTVRLEVLVGHHSCMTSAELCTAGMPLCGLLSCLTGIAPASWIADMSTWSHC